ncbi:aldehyde dehydrogenase [Athelia psychrophila]|uniref:Aldehyde dehydrogenase n=1 Tax=Athelia psychrophila TaxID=1759441 RepID=A0A166AJF3_9AGAM|nr:aldehyde dehydrogenase [Fibularhizoctonia sp. CBS 109695]
MTDFYTPLEEIPKIRDALHDAFRAGVSRPLAWRKQQLHQLARLLQENGDAITQSLFDDFRKPKHEVYFAEIAPLITRCIESAANLEDWTKPEIVVSKSAAKFQPKVYRAPKGVALIIAPWNYPVMLSLQALIGAISAGCCAVVKPSEIVPSYARLIETLIRKYLDNSAYRVVNGAPAQAMELLRLQWDHIIYTGNGRVARIIARAAAEHLTPMTLELGGKSPVIVDPACDIDLAAKRILWGKCNNAGQICVAPDYILIPRSSQDEFIAALKKHYAAFYPKGALSSDSYGRIVSSLHWSRLKSLLDRTQGEIVLGGGVDDKNGIEPTVVKNVKDGDSLMEEEIFGPLLAVVPVDSLSDAISFVNSRHHALVVYAFTDSEELKQRLVETTRSGNIVFNDVFQQMDVMELPMGGVGESGYGHQVLKASFDALTHHRSSIDVPKTSEDLLSVRYPPYTEEHSKIMAGAAFTKVAARV